MSDITRDLLAINQQLLESIASGDWATYATLCDPTLTCYEPECRGHLVEGMAFHKFYFDLERSTAPRTTTMASPHVRLLGADVVVISYARLTQTLDGDGSPTTRAMNETRVWQRQTGGWKHVHFHRSAI